MLIDSVLFSHQYRRYVLCATAPPPRHQTALRVVEENVKCAETAQKNGSPDTEKVPVMKHEGLDELSWGELEGQDSGEEPWKGKLENLRSAWNAGHFDRSA